MRPSSFGIRAESWAVVIEDVCAGVVPVAAGGVLDAGDPLSARAAEVSVVLSSVFAEHA